MSSINGSPPSTRKTPDWLRQPAAGLCSCDTSGRTIRHRYLDKTLAATTNFLRQALRADDVSEADGLLQRLDARVKLVSLFGLLVAAACIHHVSVLLGLYVAALIVGAFSAIPVGFFVKRVFLFVPIFTGIAVAPATLNVITPGQVVWSWGVWFGQSVGVTSQGLWGAALIVSRVAVSISLVVLLTLTTPWQRLLAGLRALFLPRIVVLLLAMTYRFTFVLLDSVDAMYLARKSRTPRPGRRNSESRRFVAAGAGALLGRSMILSDEVHRAMVARGWTGEVHMLDEPRIRLLDLVWTFGAIGVALLALTIDARVGV